ncbi:MULTISPECIES: hypothetical protein [unclassified Nostoc]|nr:hypothetical protein [Nostoc sp. DedQUE03]MDZ7971816.1 hypothetical protein [Nostoc sp. DedQUE03]MDZ8049001.1 hypothetical protein [Nostoc sp. DedQUE02]
MPPALSAIADGQNLRSVMVLYIRIANSVTDRDEGRSNVLLQTATRLP